MQSLCGIGQRWSLLAGATLLGLAFTIFGATGFANAAAPLAQSPTAQQPATLPDWNGAWVGGGPPPGVTVPRGAAGMFDPEHVYVEPDPSDGGLAFGPMPGTKLTGVPYKPEYQKLYDDIVKATKEGTATDTVAAGCQPYGMPRIMGGAPGPGTFILLPEVLFIVADVETRMIFLDGRQHPTGDDINMTWDGHSIGHWEGDTLVVDTMHIYAGNYDQTNPPHSDQIHVVERIRQIDANTLENEMTIEDPVMLTRPWKVTKLYRRSPTKFPDKTYSNCGPHEVVDMSNGFQNLLLPSERKAEPLK